MVRCPPARPLAGAPLNVVRFAGVGATPARPAPDAPTSRECRRTVRLRRRELRDPQLRVRAEQRTPDWKASCAVRSGADRTLNRFTHVHGMRRCRGRDKVHLRHFLTAIAIAIECLSGLPATGEPLPPGRPPPSGPVSIGTSPQPKSWRTLVGQGLSRQLQDPDRVELR
ncbi:transposase [Streptomyces sp. C10-9-1]|uniref:transposase n=1 Tax=Streptomyces sp. C10-9-1 TaxID=1859285 RepID=UPI003F4A6454